MLKYSLFIFLIFACIVLNAQNTEDSLIDFNKKFPISQLKQDLKVLKDSLEIRHPALYRFTPKNSLDAIFRRAAKKINKPMLLSEFYGIAAPIISKVGDIHTAIELPDEYQNYLATKSELFPFDVRIINQKVFIASNNSSDTSIPVGSRILKINNHPISQLLVKMKSYFSSEGTNETFKLRRVEQRFAFHYYFVYGYSRQFEIEFTNIDKNRQTKIISALPFSAIRINRSKNKILFPHIKPLFSQPPYLSLLLNKEKQTAVLTVKWFQNDVLQSSGELFKPFIDSAFSEIKNGNFKNLVIDIRNNGGGESENVCYLYSYLSNKPFHFIYSMETNKQTYEDDRKRGVKYIYFKDTGKYKTIDSSTQSSQFFGFSIQQPHLNNFTGNLYVLIDGLSTSAAPQFASLVKQNKRGLLIGEEVPGVLSGGSGRGYSYFNLPNTGLLSMISHYRLYMTDTMNKKNDTYIRPDYKTTVTIKDLLYGTDKYLEAAIILIDSNN